MNSTQDEKIESVDYWQVIRNYWGVILLTFLMSVVTAFVITTLMTRMYSSTTQFIIKPDSQTFDRSKAAGTKVETDRLFLGTEVFSIKSVETLKRADGGVNVRKYTKSLGKDYESALGVLANKIDVSVELGTSVAIVTAVDSQKEKARDLANDVREAYAARRLDARSSKSSSNRVKLEQEIEDADLRVVDTWKKLKSSSRKTGLPSVVSKTTQVVNPDQLAYEELIVQLDKKKNSHKQLEKLINDLVGLKDQDIVHYLGANNKIIEKPRVNVLYGEIKELKARRSAAFIDGYGRKHLVVVSIENQIENKEKELKTEIASVRVLAKQLLETSLGELGVLKESNKVAKDKYNKFTLAYNEHSRKIEDYLIAKSRLDQLKSEQTGLEGEEPYFGEPVLLEKAATLPSDPSSPNVLLIMGIGSVAGLVFGLGIAFLLELMDTSVKSMEDVERYIGVPILAIVPQDVGLLHTTGGSTPDAEAYRILRTNVEFNRKSPDANAISVVSGGAGEGKSTTLVNLAYICAQGGYTTLLIDGDLRRPRLHTYLNLDNTVGLTNYLTTDTSLESVIRKTETENLYFMPSGILPQDAAGILNSRRMTDMLTEVKSRFDLVFVDSPPILGVSDAAVISSEVDHTIIVIQHRKLPRKLLRRVKEAVEAVGGNIIGAVLNNVDVRSDTEYQYYTSYYTYYSATSANEAAAEAVKQKGDSKTVVASGEDLY